MSATTPIPGSRDRRTAYQRGRILAAISQEALTSRQLASKLHLSKDGINLHLRAMREASPRLVYIASYTSASNGSKGAPMYQAGNCEDAKYVKSRAPKGRITINERKAQILRLLASTMLSATEIVDRMGLQRARIYVGQLYDEARIHIGQWRPAPAGGSPIPVYAKGAGPDVQRPARQTEHEKCARYWAKLKADPHRHGIYKLCVRLRKRPQNVFSALGL